jgi:hypothetical protein
MINEITLTFDYETPPAAEDLAKVLAALARDYRDVSDGGVLTVTRVQSGSITLVVTDALLAAAPYAAAAVATMAAANTIDKFAENLKKWFGRAKTEEGKKRLYKRVKKSSGQRSVEAIISTAAKTRSRVKVRHTKASGEILEAEISPNEAARAVPVAAPLHPAKVMDQIATDRALTLDVADAVEKLRLAGSKDLPLSLLQPLIEIIVSALRMSGATNALPEIAAQLEANGLFDLAQEVRAHTRGPGKNLEPPVTT